MKHTLTVNLNGKLFNIDNDAYNMLDSYIKSLNSYFAKDSNRKEIIADFEARIQELLSARKPNTGDIISIDDVEEVIKQIGKPTEFEVDAENTNESPNEYKGYTQSEPKRTKRLFRNPNDKMLGGVCSGIAAFFNIDPTIIRIALVLLVLFSVGSVILIYIVLWILLPEAKTAEEQLQMRGEPITLENIGKIVSENTQTMGNDVKDAFNRANKNSTIAAIFKIILGILGIIIAFPIVFSLFIVLLVFVSMSGTLLAKFGSLIMTAGVIATILLIAIPLVSLIYSILSAIFKWSPTHRSIKFTSLIIWLISLVIVIFTATRIDWEMVQGKKWIKDLEYKLNKNWGLSIGDFNTVVGYGDIVEKTYNFEQPIEAIDIRNSLEIMVLEDKSISDPNTIIMVTDSNLFDELQVNLYANILTLNTRNNKNLEPTNDKIVLKVKQNVWKSIELSGATELKIADKWQVKDAQISISGASELYANNVEFDRLNINAGGSSNVEIGGSAGYAEYRVSGSSDIENEQLVSDSIIIKVSGSSDVNIYPVKYLGGNISGASKVKYYNNPDTKRVNKTGASVLYPKN